MNVKQEIKNIVAEVLDVEDAESIKDNDEFFSMGGNSLMAMMVVENIQNEFEVNFDFASLYEHTTIQDISHLVEQKLAEKKGEGVEE